MALNIYNTNLDILGIDPNDQFGTSVALSADGHTMAVGSLNGASSAGSVRVFKWNTNTYLWTMPATELTGLSAGDKFGTSVAFSADGHTMAVGSPNRTSSAGSVRVFKWNTSTNIWDDPYTEFAGNNTGENFGTSVALSADGYTVAIGATGHTKAGDTTPNRGIARIFKFNVSTDQWTNSVTEIEGLAGFDNFGQSVSLSGDGNTLVIGTDNENSIRVFKFNASTSQWDLPGTVLNGLSSSDNFGKSVALSADGHTMAVGSPNRASSAGRVRVFKWNISTDSWDDPYGEFAGNNTSGKFGTSVSLSANGNTLIGGTYAPDGINSIGYIKAFRWNTITSAWGDLGNEIYGDDSDGKFGFSVSSSADGNTLVGGGPFINASTGIIKVFRWTGLKWTQDPILRYAKVTNGYIRTLLNGILKLS
jgi:hypothetical protein